MTVVQYEAEGFGLSIKNGEELERVLLKWKEGRFLEVRPSDVLNSNDFKIIRSTLEEVLTALDEMDTSCVVSCNVYGRDHKGRIVETVPLEKIPLVPLSLWSPIHRHPAHPIKKEN